MKPVIYQVFPRYWGDYNGGNVRGGSLEENGCGHFADVDSASIRYWKNLGCTHIWYTGVIRHATSCSTHGCTPSHPQTVKGAAGSPYAIVDYYDVNPYLAYDPTRRMEEFEALVRRTHEQGLKVIIDFVPNHVSRDNVNFGTSDDTSVHWKSENDFFYYPSQALELPVPFTPDETFAEPYSEMPARATGNNCFRPTPGMNDWYETVKINYCPYHTATWDKMLDILRFWAAKGVDGFRCDMVELVPAEFFEWAIATLKAEYPEIIFIAEVYSRENYRPYIRKTGFDYLYDKSGVYDALFDIVRYNCGASGNAPLQMWQSARRLTANWQYLDDLQGNMLNFLENHDEVRLCSEAFASKPAVTKAALAYAALFNTAAFMIYAGGEVGESASDSEGFSGEDGRSTIFDWWKTGSTGRLYRWIHACDDLSDSLSADNAPGWPLLPQEAATLSAWQEVLHLASMPHFRDGAVYDLCFCNLASPGFDADRHFAFLRYNSQICTLVVCNFAPVDAEIDLDIPTRGLRRKVSVGACDYIAIDL